MNQEDFNFCPPWLFKLTTSVIVYDFIVRDKAIFFSLKKFGSFFSKKYQSVDSKELELSANLVLQFLGELKIDKNTYLLINHYMYNLIWDIKPSEKGIFKTDPYEGTKKKEYSVDEAVNEFKVFCFSCRSGLTRKAPTGWDIVNEEALGEFKEVLESEFSIDDMIDDLMD